MEHIKASVSNFVAKERINELKHKIESIRELGCFGPGRFEFDECQEKLEEYEAELEELISNLGS